MAKDTNVASSARGASYPSLPLDKAIDRVEDIYDALRDVTIQREDAAQALGYKSLSGAANQTLGALRSYGLLEQVGRGTVKVSERAKAILHPLPGHESERFENLSDAAMAPPVFQKIHNAFGAGVPPKPGVISVLKRESYKTRAAETAAAAYIATMEFLATQEGVEESSNEVDPGDAPGPDGNDPARQQSRQETQPPPPPSETDGLHQVLGAVVGDGVYAKVMVKGEYGPTENRNLIRYLEVQQAILEGSVDSEPEPI